ncbi:MAG: LysR family transcriptional regulator [Puniceicoccales bacterium]|jgi:DNA-binding transcriptional LysR family regulator|nr:LysR family transcriptional regulator [Puniceicoccales bacterium]
MHIENLKVFVSLAETQSFSRTGKLHGITQSAVSQQLRALENHFGVQIVDRNQKIFRLTREGECLRAAAQDITRGYDILINDLKEMRHEIAGTIRLSTIYSIGLHELPPIVKHFLSKYRTVDVRIAYRRSNLVVEDILRGEADLGLIAYPTKTRDLEVIPFAEDCLVVICNPAHPLAKRKRVKLAELASQCFIGFDHDIPTRKATDRIFCEYGVKLVPSMEFDNVETLKRAVEVGAGVALVPAETVRQEVAQQTLVELSLEDCHIKRPLAYIHRKTAVLTPAMVRLVDTSTELGKASLT